MDPARARIDNLRVAALVDRERRRFVKEHPRGVEALAKMRAHIVGASGETPVVVNAKGARLRDVDGRDYVDFRLGDGAALAGHGADAAAAAATRRFARGPATGLPGEDEAAVGEELTRRFGLPLWAPTATAEDAIRAALRLARRLTGRERVLLFEGHGYGGLTEIGSPRVVGFNDLDAARAALAEGDVACILTEPALTVGGLVPPASGFHGHLQAAAREAGALLVFDERQTIACGIGGYTREHKLTPDLLVLGSAMAAGAPAGALGFSREAAERLGGLKVEAPAAEALALATMRATLTETLTEGAYRAMIGRASTLASGLVEAIRRRDLGWTVTKIGARCGLAFAASPPQNGADCAAARQPGLEAWLNLYFLNEGVVASTAPPRFLVTPATGDADVAKVAEVFGRFVETAIAEGAIAP